MVEDLDALASAATVVGERDGRWWHDRPADARRPAGHVHRAGGRRMIDPADGGPTRRPIADWWHMLWRPVCSRSCRRQVSTSEGRTEGCPGGIRFHPKWDVSSSASSRPRAGAVLGHGEVAAVCADAVLAPRRGRHVFRRRRTGLCRSDDRRRGWPVSRSPGLGRTTSEQQTSDDTGNSTGPQLHSHGGHALPLGSRPELCPKSWLCNPSARRRGLAHRPGSRPRMPFGTGLVGCTGRRFGPRRGRYSAAPSAPAC